MIAGRYQLDGELGRGGMAEVRAGTDLRLQRQVAVKFLLPEMAAREDIRRRFEAEARAAASLSDPHAVAVFDTGEHDGLPYIVMERLPGETLGDRIAAGPVDQTWLRQVACEVLGALGVAHAGGLIHRDVKPGNILLTADGHAKIADFGIAKSLEGSGGTVDLTGTGQLLGTPAYLAPERLDGAPATARSDLYSLGVVLYEALAGTRPFPGDTPLATARAVMVGDFAPLGGLRPDLDPSLVATVERAMARDPDRRFASAAAMADALSPAPAGGTALGTPTLVDGVGGPATSVLDRSELEQVRPAPVVTAATVAARPPWARVPLALIVGLAFLALLVYGLHSRSSSTSGAGASSTATLDGFHRGEGRRADHGAGAGAHPRRRAPYRRGPPRARRRGPGRRPGHHHAPGGRSAPGQRCGRDGDHRHRVGGRVAADRPALRRRRHLGDQPVEPRPRGHRGDVAVDARGPRAGGHHAGADQRERQGQGQEGLSPPAREGAGSTLPAVTGRLDMAAALRAAQSEDPSMVGAVLTVAARDLGATDVVAYLVDFEQQVLEPLPDRSAHAELPRTEEVTNTMAGRAFLTSAPVTAERPGGTRVWVPIIEGSDRTGVLALTVPDLNETAVSECADLGLLAGYLVAVHARCTDLYQLHRRRKTMSLAASMQWDLLPPLVLRTPSCTVAARLEPAYEVGGDCLDYSLNGPILDLAVIDSMGHGVTAASIASLVIGCYRHGRRLGHPLAQLHASINEVIEKQFAGEAFATGQLVQLELGNGTLTRVNAGHPQGLLVRNGQVVKQLEGPVNLPWGMGASPAESAAEALEPADAVLFFTDGVVEARTPEGEEFGVSRLADITGQCASNQLQPEEVVRMIVQGVLNHQGTALHDDATVMLVTWHGDGASVNTST